MIRITKGQMSFEGPQGTLPVSEHDEIAVKLAMLYEGECESGPSGAAQ